MAGIDRRGFIAGLGALIGTSSLVRQVLPAAEVVTSTIDVARTADRTVYWLANNSEFYILRYQEEPVSLFEALRDGTPAGPIYKGEIGRWLGITWHESTQSAEQKPVDSENR